MHHRHLDKGGRCCNISLVSVGIGTIQDYHRLGDNLCRLVPRLHLCHHFPSRHQRPLFQAAVKKVAAGHHHRLCSDPLKKHGSCRCRCCSCCAVAAVVEAGPDDHTVADAAVSVVRVTASVVCEDDQSENLSQIAVQGRLFLLLTPV